MRLSLSACLSVCLSVSLSLSLSLYIYIERERERGEGTIVCTSKSMFWRFIIHPSKCPFCFRFLFRTANTAQGKQSSQSNFSLRKYFPLIRRVAIKCWRVIHEPSHFEPESVKKYWKKESTDRAEQRGIWVLYLFCAVRGDYRSGNVRSWHSSIISLSNLPTRYFTTCSVSSLAGFSYSVSDKLHY